MIIHLPFKETNIFWCIMNNTNFHWTKRLLEVKHVKSLGSRKVLIEIIGANEEISRNLVNWRELSWESKLITLWPWATSLFGLIHLFRSLINLFAIYGNFYFIYNFWVKWKNKVPCLFGCLLKTLGFNIVIFSILHFFWGNFSYFLSLSLTQIMGLGVS